MNPFWPLLAQMLGGSWLALPWFVLNGVALGSPTQRREWLCAAASLLGSVALVFSIGRAVDAGTLEGMSLRLAMLSIVALKITVAYALFVMQSRSFELWQYFGGKARNGVLVLMAGFFVRAKLLAALGAYPLLAIALG